MDYSKSRRWNAANWLANWVATCDKDLSLTEPIKFNSECEARTWRFDFTSPWVDCVGAAHAGIDVPDEVWSVADDLRRRGAEWSLSQVRDMLQRKAEEFKQVEQSFPSRNAGDWLVEIAVAMKRHLPARTSWLDVDKFVRNMRDEGGLEVPGEVYTIVRGLIERHKGDDAVSAAEAAQVLFVHGMINGATMKNISQTDADDMSGWR